eukprot:2369855-Amphidinium_carterae.2
MSNECECSQLHVSVAHGNYAKSVLVSLLARPIAKTKSAMTVSWQDHTLAQTFCCPAQFTGCNTFTRTQHNELPPSDARSQEEQLKARVTAPSVSVLHSLLPSGTSNVLTSQHSPF